MRANTAVHPRTQQCPHNTARQARAQRSTNNTVLVHFNIARRSTAVHITTPVRAVTTKTRAHTKVNQRRQPHTKARPDPHSTESHGTANTRTLSGVQTTQATHTRAQHCAPTTHGTELAQHCKTSPARQRTITPIMHERTHAQHNTRAHWQNIARTPNRAHTRTHARATVHHGTAVHTKLPTEPAGITH